MSKFLRLCIVVFSCFSVNNLAAQVIGDSVRTILSGPTNNAPNGVEAFDMDNDGDIDVVSNSHLSNSVFWSENLGDGTFINHTISTNNLKSIGLKVTDLDNDGDLDIINVSRDDNKVSIFINSLVQNGTASFSHAFDLTHILQPTEISVADLNHDGNQDLIVSGWGDKTLNVYYNAGNLAFTHAVIDTNFDRIESNMAMDVDNDGNLDIIASNNGHSCCPEQARMVWYKQEAGVFTAIELPVGTTGMKGLTSADLNNDGLYEIIYTSYVLNKGLILWNSPSHTFDSTTAYITANGINVVQAIDINHDGFKDLIHGEGRVSAIGYCRNDGAGHFPDYYGTEHKLIEGSVIDLALGDMDLDGDQDFIFSLIDVDKVVWVENTQELPCTIQEFAFEGDYYTYEGKEAFIHLVGSEEGVEYFVTNDPEVLGNGVIGTGGAISVSAGILEAGANPFYIVAVKNETCSKVFEGTGILMGNQFVPASPVYDENMIMIDANFPLAESAYFLDFDFDGLTDIYAVSRKELRLYINEGLDNYTPYTIGSGFNAALDVKAGDFNNDNHFDFVVTDDGTKSIYLFTNNGNSTFTKTTIATGISGVLHFDVAHMNEDNLLDIVLTNNENQEIILLTNQGDNTFLNSTLASTSGTINSSVIADLNQDGLMDIIWANNNSTDKQLAWLEQQENGSFTNHFITTSLRSFYGGDLVGDMDNDGDIDFAIGSLADNVLYLYINDGQNNFSEKLIASGINVQTVELVDMDNDDNLDISTNDHVTNQAIWFENMGSNNFYQHTFDLGITGPTYLDNADMDHDGDQDAVVTYFTAGKITLLKNNNFVCTVSGDISHDSTAYTTGGAGIEIHNLSNGYRYQLLDENYDIILTSGVVEGSFLHILTSQLELGQNIFHIQGVKADNSCTAMLAENIVIIGVDPIQVTVESNIYNSNKESFTVNLLSSAYEAVGGINGKFAYDKTAFSHVELDLSQLGENEICEYNNDTAAGTINFIWSAPDLENGKNIQEGDAIFKFIFYPNENAQGIYTIDLSSYQQNWTISTVTGEEKLVTPNNGTVEIATPITFYTEISTANGQLVPDVNLSYEGRGGFGDTTIANAYYQGTVLPGNFAFNMVKFGTEDPTNGINVADITLMRRHILQIEELSGMSRFAADVNGDNLSNLSDMLSVKLVILEILDSYQGNLWRFAPANYEANPDSGLAWDFNIDLLEDYTYLDFTAIKLGDVNNSYDGPLNSATKAPIAFNLVFGQKDINGNTPVYLPNNMDLTGIQFTLESTDGNIEILAGTMDIQQGKSENGATTAIWEDESTMGITFDSEEPIFYVKSKGNVSVSDKYTESLVSDANLKVFRFGSDNATGIADNNAALNNCVSIFPIPASNVLNIDLCADNKVLAYKMVAADGKIVLTATANAETVRIERSDLPEAGVYQMVITTTKGVVTKAVMLK